MGAERRPKGHGRAVRGAVLLAVGAVLLTGCVSMPDSGDIKSVKPSQAGESRVRVFAVPPREGAPAEEIVEGFLEAMTSDDPKFDTARQYLTESTAQAWQPEVSTTVLASSPLVSNPVRGGKGSPGRLDYTLTGDKLADVRGGHEYTASGRPTTPYKQHIHLTQETVKGSGNKEWRIDSLPPGLLLGESDFQRNYRSINRYYYDNQGRDSLVADPVYIRQREDPVTQRNPLAQAVDVALEDSSPWLGPVVRSTIPTETALQDGVKTLTPDDQNTLKVPLKGKIAQSNYAACRKMAAQIMATVQELATPKVDQVELVVGGKQKCVVEQGDVDAYMSWKLDARSDEAYYLDAKGQLARLQAGAKSPSTDDPRVLGPFGSGQTRLGRVAVARDQKSAAGVSEDGRQMRIAPFDATAPLPPPAVTSTGKTPEEGLSTPTWDMNGDVWVADRNPAGGHLWLVPRGAGPGVKREVGLPDAVQAGQIEALRLSPDGMRVALRVRGATGTKLLLARVERAGSGEQQTVSLLDPRDAAPRMDSVTAVSWAGPSRLVVIGKESKGVQQVRYLQTDGSTPEAGILPGLNQVKDVAASPSDRMPLVASSDDGIVRLPPGGNWQSLVAKGTAPVYPG
ncbi:LpqB family beta-propeller domain-containing protein [Streptomyces sp. NPDC001941]|uniref:LpqB family beta-propeller domain-containing protein n=1 Tax=Streptomyces sp. NPDC001941 TaxID=3154659 RepID=UPI0033200799